MSAEAADPKSLNVLESTRIYQAVCFGIFLWEYILTLRREWQYIWKRSPRLSVVNVAFAWNRHVGLIAQITFLYFFTNVFSAERCRHVNFVNPALAASLFAASMIIFSVRVIALWDRSRIIIIFLIALSTACFFTNVFAVAHYRPLPLPPGERGCIAIATGAYSYVAWIGPLVFDTVALCLTISPVIRYRLQGGKMPIFNIILRDGIIYFGIVFTVNFVNFLFFVVPNIANRALHAPLSVTLTSIMCSRIVFNMRSMAAESVSHPSNSKSSGSRMDRSSSEPPNNAVQIILPSRLETIVELSPTTPRSASRRKDWTTHSSQDFDSLESKGDMPFPFGHR
ncbi:hypothetical protein BT69DRAFT_1281560 [Atractiella rhizophila]|nr:hypothetical protein BT69DRAFT_1281560 [Atractiella rhizophila]